MTPIASKRASDPQCYRSVLASGKLCRPDPTVSRHALVKTPVMTPRRASRTDLSEARWALIEPILAAWRAARAEAGLGLRGPVHDLREIVNAILYVNRTGIAWEYLPHDFPPFKTVYDYYAKWEAGGLTEAIHGELRRKVRKAAGRSAEPSAAILAAQSIRTSGNVPESSQGIDAGKKIKGRKRHIATDTLGLLLVLLVTAASVQDTTGGRDVGGQRLQAQRHRDRRRARHRRRDRQQGSRPERICPVTEAVGR